MKKVLLAAILLSVVLPGRASALVIGYYLSDTTGSPATAIGNAGHTAMALGGLSAGDLTGIDVVWILNGNNDSPDAAVTGNLAALTGFVSGGGVLSIHDRAVDGAEAYVPGGGAIDFVRDFSDDANIQVLANNTVTNGPGGVIDNTSLDGGTSSSHGYATLATLPISAFSVLSRGNASEIVDFYYPLGLGWVYYSTMPLDYYLEGNGPNPPLGNYTDIYAVNEAAFQAELAGGAPVPEPGTLLLLGSGVAGLALRRRRRSKQPE